MHAQVSASDADAASFADRELFRGQAAWGAMHLPHARCLCGNAFSFSRARPPTRSDDLRAWTKAPMRMRRDETATWEQAGGGALRNGALASYLPTVWLASCLIRLNCFFILNGAAISAERPASLRRNDAASKKEQKEERKGKTCHKKKKTRAVLKRRSDNPNPSVSVLRSPSPPAPAPENARSAVPCWPEKAPRGVSRAHAPPGRKRMP